MKVGMLFPGYGSQFVGMGKELYDDSRIMQEYFEEASNCLGMNFVKLCFASSDAELSKIAHAYTSLFLVSVATAAVIQAQGISFDLVAGHGIGEYSALCSANGLSFPDGLYLLNKLGNFYTQSRENLDVRAVTVQGLSARKLKKICKDSSSCHEGEAQIAIYETKTDHVVVGNPEVIADIIEMVKDEGEKVRKSKLEEGLHSPFVSELFDQLKMYLTKVDFKDVNTQLVTNVDAKLVVNAQDVQSAVMRQIVEPLYWFDVLKQFADMDLILIPAPAKNLVLEVQAYYPDKKVVAIQHPDDVIALKELVAPMQAESKIETELTTVTV